MDPCAQPLGVRERPGDSAVRVYSEGLGSRAPVGSLNYGVNRISVDPTKLGVVSETIRTMSNIFPKRSVKFLNTSVQNPKLIRDMSNASRDKVPKG